MDCIINFCDILVTDRFTNIVSVDYSISDGTSVLASGTLTDDFSVRVTGLSGGEVLTITGTASTETADGKACCEDNDFSVTKKVPCATVVVNAVIDTPISTDLTAVDCCEASNVGYAVKSYNGGGTVAINDPNLDYTPEAGFSGLDQALLEVCCDGVVYVVTVLFDVVAP